MKFAHFLTPFFALVLFACGPDPDPTPVQPTPGLKPLKMTEAGIVRELVYDNNGRLEELVFTNESVSGQDWSSITAYTYDTQGRISESTTDTGWHLVYFYTGQHITATDEYVSGVLSQQHHFTYDDQGRLQTKLTTQDIPEEGGVIPVSREDYQYDDHGNVSVLELYYYTTGGAES